MNDNTQLDIKQTERDARRCIAEIEKEVAKLNARRAALTAHVEQLLKADDPGLFGNDDENIILIALRIREGMAINPLGISPGHNIAALRRLQAALTSQEE